MKSMKTTLFMSIALTVAFVSAGWSQTGAASKLVGTKKCAMCHKKEEAGNQYGKWQAMAHSKAYELLGTEEAKAVGAKLGIENPQTSGACLKCHSTAYYFTETKQTEAVAIEDGVSCESCHGPGEDYKKKTTMENHDEAIAAGLVYPAKEKSCTLCHNDTGPTWNPGRYTLPDGTQTGFDATQAYEKIKHDRPAK